MPYANNKGAVQPAHPRNLISAFVVRFVDCIISIPLLQTYKTGLSHTGSQPLEDRFSRPTHAGHQTEKSWNQRDKARLSKAKRTKSQGHMSHVMRKPVFVICEQQRRRSACISAQSDQRLCCSLRR